MKWQNSAYQCKYYNFSNIGLFVRIKTLTVWYGRSIKGLNSTTMVKLNGWNWILATGCSLWIAGSVTPLYANTLCKVAASPYDFWSSLLGFLLWNSTDSKKHCQFITTDIFRVVIEMLMAKVCTDCSISYL